jgi:hypothetical protein
LDQSENTGFDNAGVCEMNCNLEPGRYLVVASLANRQAVEGRLQLAVNTWVSAFSEHPCVSERMTPFTDLSFKLGRSKHGHSLKGLSHHKNLADWWRVAKLPGMKKLQRECYSEFLRNPGGLLRFSRRGTFRLHLSSTNYSQKFAAATDAQSQASLQKPPYLTVCLLQMHSFNRFDVVLEDHDYSSAAWGYWTP